MCADVYGLPAAPAATYYGKRPPHGYAVILEHALARVLERNGTICLRDGFDRSAARAPLGVVPAEGAP